MALPASADEERLPKGALWLGSPEEINANAEVEVPAGYRVELPEAIHLKKDFAEYDSTYDFKEGKLISKRRLKTLLHEVPARERENYKEFAKKIQDDYGLFITLTSVRESQATESQPPPARLPSSKTFDAIRNLPDSPIAEALRLEKEARSALEKHDVQGALTALYRATAADSQFIRAWVLLGGLLLSSKQIDAGVEAFHKAIAAAPNEPAIPKMLGMGLMAPAQFEAAVSAWQDFLKTQPDDFDGNMNLGRSLVQLKRYPEAAAVFETAAKAHADRADVQADLASAYLLGGEDEKAGQTYQKLADTQPSQTILNNAAYQMAQHKVLLPQALDFSKKAVRLAEEQSQKISRSKYGGCPADLYPQGSLGYFGLGTRRELYPGSGLRISTCCVEAHSGRDCGEPFVPGLQANAQNRGGNSGVSHGRVSHADGQPYDGQRGG
jgi:tetratricopeptide (TPR) repeat protein